MSVPVSTSTREFHHAKDTFVEQWKQHHAIMLPTDAVRRSSKECSIHAEDVWCCLDLAAVLAASRHRREIEMVHSGEDSRSAQRLAHINRPSEWSTICEMMFPLSSSASQ